MLICSVTANNGSCDRMSSLTQVRGALAPEGNPVDQFEEFLAKEDHVIAAKGHHVERERQKEKASNPICERL